MKEIQYKAFSLRTHKENWRIKRPNVCQSYYNRLKGEATYPREAEQGNKDKAAADKA